MAKLNAAIEHGLSLKLRQPDNTLIPLEVVSLYQERARLTGNYDDYAKAEALLASLTSESKLSASQCMAQARLHYTLHRLKQASAVLDGCGAIAEASELAALRADIALYSGRYRDAERTYRDLVNDVGIAPHYVRLGLLKKWVGGPGEAAALLEAAERRYHGSSPTMRAWLKLQRGLLALERGRFDEALAMYRLAEDALEGWWLIDEHIAEVHVLNGNIAEAKRIYESVIKRTGSPEFMDALAKIEHQLGNAEQANKLTAQARSIYTERLRTFPEAAAGHALDHFLKNQADAVQALALAQKNYQTRPYGESAIALAKAWIMSGMPERARPLIEAQLATGWDTAEAWWILSEIQAQLRSDQQAARSEALRRNPHSEKMYGFTAGVLKLPQ
ncbi:MAG: tetratricopeptide repeat protein [Betaproteobacteria bacterium]